MPRARLGPRVAAGVMAFGAMTALAPAANADKPQTEGQIKAGCDQANGTYDSWIGTDGNRYSTCCYRDYKGQKYCDAYQNGSYIETTPWAQSPPASGPATPPANNAPIQTKPPPGAAPPPPGPVTGGNPPVAPPITKGPPAANAN
jgi:hypothetical protein